MLASRRRMTQSEKHKYLVECSGQPVRNFSLKQSSSLQFLECQQNIVHTRTLRDKCIEIDKAKSKSIAKINGEKHLLKLKYKGLIKEDENDDITRTFFLQPGFRFRSNGDIKKIHEPPIVSDSEFNKSSMSLAKHSILDKKSSSSLKDLTQEEFVNTKGFGNKGFTTKSQILDDADVNKVIKEIEKDLENMKTDKELIEINRKIQEVKNSLTFVRAHTNDYRPEIQYISTKPDEKELLLQQLKQHENYKKGDIQGKMSRRCNKLNCIACEFRLKCTSDSKPLVHKSGSSQYLKRWNYAPRGSYVGTLKNEEIGVNSVYSHKDRISKSAKHVAHYTESSSLAKNLSKLRSSKSAAPTLKRDHLNETKHNIDGNRKVRGAVQRCREREKDISKDTFCNESLTNNVSSLYHDVESENVLNVHTYDYGDHPLNEVNDQKDEKPNQSIIDILSRKLSNEKEAIKEKMDHFFDRLPEVQPSIATWRNSSGRLVTWKPHEWQHNQNSPRPGNLTWAQYHKAKQDPSLEHTMQYKFYLSSQEKLSGDPNSIEELRKCRYLREFKMRKNLEIP